MNIQELDQTYLAHAYGRFGITLTEGKGSLFFDENGKEYIDLGTGIGVNAFGVADPAWCEAIAKQAMSLSHTSNLYHTCPQVRLAELLCQRTGMKKVFFSNSGAEANECAIKAARKYHSDLGRTDRFCILSLQQSFHGRTLATLTATGQEVFHHHFDPFPGGFVYGSNTDADALIALAKEHNCGAILMECVQGEGGVLPLQQAFADKICAYAKETDTLILIDEVQTGNGRTGTLYAYEQFGIRPDIVSTAKGLGGGLPIGATLFSEKTEGVLTPSSHGSTFGGNPICCAGAYSILSRIDDALLQGVKERSAYIKQALEGAKGVKSISGLGLMLGIETERPAKEVVLSCMERGVLVLTAKDKVRLLPALNIPMDLLERAIAILKEELGA